MTPNAACAAVCRSPHGERGLKFLQMLDLGSLLSRSPHGERGLKSHDSFPSPLEVRSLSSRRAWIEINIKRNDLGQALVALLTESVD